MYQFFMIDLINSIFIFIISNYFEFMDTTIFKKEFKVHYDILKFLKMINHYKISLYMILLVVYLLKKGGIINEIIIKDFRITYWNCCVYFSNVSPYGRP